MKKLNKYEYCLKCFNDILNFINQKLPKYRINTDIFDIGYKMNNIRIYANYKKDRDKVISVVIENDTTEIRYQFVLTKKYFYYTIETTVNGISLYNCVIRCYFNIISKTLDDIGNYKDFMLYSSNMIIFLNEKLLNNENRI